ncbi:DUF4031 domain-containing protein [Antribacter gilvus]|uniref:DUF4031 domain-containing protein n=1 Tax=Antribacter gilvus TaxID=2304675 RepID=UPI000F78D041|nr:DUF4031 domain-containing protein [Antribacter gilvus]
MTVLIDPPAWPAHGTLFSHLVSDESLYELRLFARAAGVPDRALDLDHYDVPARRYDALVAAGAVPVDGRELARRLGGSVVRVSGAERGHAARDSLGARWSALRPGEPGCPDVGPTPDGSSGSAVSPEAWAAVGESLLDRWSEPHRTYHTRLHLAQSLDALDLLLDDLAAAGTPVEPATAWTARVALWFHDAVHDGEAVRDEERSAELARTALSAIDPGDPVHPGDAPASGSLVEEVARLVLVTTAHDPAPGDLAGALVSDADLAVLGAEPPAYARYAQQVRAEYADVPELRFRLGRAAVLTQLLAGRGLFRTVPGAARWNERATANLRAERRSLTARPPR